MIAHLVWLLTVLAPDPDAAAKLHFEKAERAYRMGNYDVAIVEYREAYDARPIPALLYNLAQAYRKRYAVAGQLPDLRRAIEVFRAYLRDDPHSSQRETVERILAELRASLTEAEERERRSPSPAAPAAQSAPGRLIVQANVPGAEVFLDDDAIGPAPIARSAPPGLHRLRVEQPGFAAWTAQLELQPGQTLRQTALLVELPAPAPLGDAAERPVYRRWWFWTAIGGGLVAAAVTAVAVSSGGDASHTPTIDLSR
jgi:tetratricopeptide (TPR) repeat protein